MRWKTRTVTISTHARNGDVTNRAWRVTRTQEWQVESFLGPPDLENFMPADTVKSLQGTVESMGMVTLEPSRDHEAEALDEQVVSPMRSLVGTVMPSGDVQMMIIHGRPPHEGPQTVAIIPNATVIIKAHEFERWLDGMKDWWKANR